MSVNTSNEAVRYFSRYTHGVDEKRRVQIPAKWRPDPQDMEWALILWENNAHAGACLRVYPPKQMDALIQKIEGMSHRIQLPSLSAEISQKIVSPSPWIRPVAFACQKK